MRKKHKNNCNCAVCKIKRKEPHKEKCNCMACRMIRGETKEENNPFYNKKHTKEVKNFLSIINSGEKHPKFKGTKRHGGYVYIFYPNHPNSDREGYVKRANLIMEEKIGRYLTKEEIVHHINGIRDDDRIENLMLFKNNNEHIGYHNTLRKNNGK